jgi:glucosamine 6-phosphate synthetase-like amidotransferase/phosphosugar isomerase protein
MLSKWYKKLSIIKISINNLRNLMKKIFELSERIIKIKNKLFILSLVCLFIGLTKISPSSFNLIGIAFENTQKIKEIINWFLFYITLIFVL